MPKAMNRVILLFGVLATLTASSAAQPFMPKPPGPVERDFVWDRATAGAPAPDCCLINLYRAPKARMT